MFSKLAVALVSVAAVASAMPAAADTNQCNVSSLQCCSSIQAPQSQTVQSQLGLFNLAAGAISGFLGVQCNPISGLIGTGVGSNCNAIPVCCEDNTFNGVIAVGCTPVNVNL